MRVPVLIIRLTALAWGGAALTCGTVVPASAATAPRQAVIANQPVYIDHMESGAQLVPTAWAPFPGQTIQGYHTSSDAGFSSHPTMYQWILVPVAGLNGQSTYQLRNVSSSLCISAPGDVGAGTQVVLKQCQANDWSEKWVFWDSTTGIPKGVTVSPALNPDLALSPLDANVHQDFRVALEPTGEYLNQIWRTRAA